MQLACTSGDRRWSVQGWLAPAAEAARRGLPHGLRGAGFRRTGGVKEGDCAGPSAASRSLPGLSPDLE